MLLALTFVVAISAVTFAVTTTSVDGKVEWTYDSADQFGGSDDGKVILDLGKDFGEGYSAGLKIKLSPNENVDVLDTTPATVSVDKADSVKFDGNGWIQMVKDLYTIKFQTGGLGGNSANELGVGYDMDGQAGLQVTSDKLMEGLALTLVLNDKRYDNPGPEVDNDFYQYLMKAVYTADPLTVGFGYQAHSVPTETVPDSKMNDMMALWAGYKLSDALSFGFEYASRPNLDGLDTDGNVVEGSTGIRVKADYTAGALTVNGKVQIQTGAFFNMDPDDIGTTSAWNYFQFGQKIGTGSDPKDGSGVSGTAIKVDGSYKLTDALTAGATVEMIMDGAFTGTGVELTDKQLMSYKLSVTDQMSEQLKLEGWYAGYGDISEIGGKASYNFVAGLEGSLEVKSNTTAPADPVNSYKVTIKATL
ncbi:MAG TPA: hypothetical protein VHY08_02280 [Bacillota bacterium]|nr:hypothetical protein [Bacillota bacterium]